MAVCYCLQFSINYEEPCELTYTDCEGNLVTETFSNGQYSICSQDLVPESPCPEISFYVNGLCIDGQCGGVSVATRNECDPITIFPMGVQCLVNNPTYTTTYDGSAALSITGGTPPYTIIWDIGGISAAITNLGPGEYGATIVDYYGDFTANTICVLTASTPTVTPTPTPTPSPVPTYDDICFVVKRRIGGFTTTEIINFNYNGIYNGKPTWISDDLVYNIVWETLNNQWEISGWTNGDMVNINPSTPPIIGWQSIGGLGVILSINVTEGTCGISEEVAYKMSKTEPTCDCDGSIVIETDLGNPPYQFSIDNGKTLQDSPIFNELCFGSYDTLVIDSSGYTKSEKVTLYEPLPFTNYTLELEVNKGLGTFNVGVTPQLPDGCYLTFDLVHTKNFEVSPTISAATYNNNIILNVNGSPVGLSTTSANNSITILPKICSPGSKYTTITENRWNGIIMNSSTTIDGTISDVITSVTPSSNCYDAEGSYTLALDNVQINDCNCSNIFVINPVFVLERR